MISTVIAPHPGFAEAKPPLPLLRGGVGGGVKRMWDKRLSLS
ncbi:hypothetical protein NSTC745_03634 [Nostoc sp. DSM 114161]